MLITFKTEVYANITMFGDVAVALLKLMGHSGSVPGAIMPEDIADALQRLEKAVAADPGARLNPRRETQSEEEGDEMSVSLAHRALPLISLLRAACAEGKLVMWESSTD